MTREEAKEYLPIMQAFAEGKDIQIRNITDDGWDDIHNDRMSFCAKAEAYRIKPESMYRPFKTQEECWNEMHKHSDFGWVIRSGVYLNISGVYCDTIYTLEDSNGIHFDYAFLELTFTDGAPFGVKEE